MIKARHIAREVLANVFMGFTFVKDRRVRRGRTTHEDVLKQKELIIEAFRFFMDTIGWERIKNKTVVEIGPGDAIPLAALFIGAGAKQYIAFDRFPGDVMGERALALYKAVEDSAPDSVKATWEALGIVRGSFKRFINSELVLLSPVAIEEAKNLVAADFIVSFNVLEHLRDLPQSLRHMVAMLNKDGLMIHRVDYSAHDIWRNYPNPLTFLTIPASLWQLMGSNRGYPNRIRHPEVLRHLADLGLNTTDRITRRTTKLQVDEIRPRLPDTLRCFSDDELAILSAEFASSAYSVPSLGQSFNDSCKSGATQAL
jgi:SAM-dependent methyltransferase